MSTCKECDFFFPVSLDDGDYELGKGDCVTPHEHAKGRYWLSKPTFESSAICATFHTSTQAVLNR